MELLERLRTAGLTVSRTGNQLVVAPRDRLTDELRAAIRAAKPQLLSALQPKPTEMGNETHAGAIAAPLSSAQEAARWEVLAQLEANPSVQRAFVNRFNEDGTMVVMLAIRGVGTGELHIPAERFNQASLDDYGALLNTIEGAG